MAGPKLEEVLAERGGRYGFFMDNSKVFAQLMEIQAASPNGKLTEEARAFPEAVPVNALSPTAQHALSMIYTKLSRILTGDPNYDDNWRDIAGYATIMVDICNGVKR